MSNMSYCRFSNTLLDLKDCVYTLEEYNSLEEMNLSEEELKSLKQMYSFCERFIDAVDDLR